MADLRLVECDHCGKQERRESLPTSDDRPKGWISLYVTLAQRGHLIHAPGQVNQHLRSRDFCSSHCAQQGLMGYLIDWNAAITAALELEANLRQDRTRGWV